MLCCSTLCGRFKTCGHAYINNPNSHENLEPFDRFGAGSYSYNSETQEVECKSWVICDHFSMYYPTSYEHKEKVESNYTNKEHQITIDELLENSNGNF